MTYNSGYGSTLNYKLAIRKDTIQNIMKNDNADDTVCAKFIKQLLENHFASKDEYNYSSIHDGNVYSKEYYKLLALYQLFNPKDQNVYFDISNNVTISIVEWLQNKKEVDYKICSIFSNDLSIMFSDRKIAAEFKLKFLGQE